MTHRQQLPIMNDESSQDGRKTDTGIINRRRFLQGAAAVVGGAALRRALPASAALRSAFPSQAQTAINVMDAAYGAKGDGATNDRAAFQAAIDAAIATQLPLWVPEPPQFYRITLDPNNPHLRVDGDLTIAGEGRNSTVLRFTAQTTETGKHYAGLFVTGGSDFQLADLRLEEDLHQPVEQFEFMGVFFESGGVDHACLVESVDIEGFTYCLYAPSSGVDGGKGELFLAVRDCDLHPWWQYCVAFWTVPDGHKRLHIYDSYLHDNQHSHLVYCHPHNSVHIENTRFDGANSWAFHFQGSEVSGDPEYQRFIGCWFGPRNSRGIITQDRATVATQVEVRNCVFEGRPSVQIRSDIIIDGCYFTSPKDPTVIQPFVGAYSNSPWRATIRNCIFAPKSNSLPQADFRLENIDITIENCQFYHQGSGVMLNLGTGAANRYAVSNCVFYNRPDNASQAISIEIDNGQATIDNCRFFGRSIGDRGTIVLTSSDTGPSAESLFQIDNCSFQNISGGSLFFALQSTGNSWSNKIVGGNNRINNMQTGKPMLMVEPVAPVFGHLAPVAGPAPSSIPAGPTMVISSNYDTYGVLGSADVMNLHWWTADGLSDPLFSGAITLIATTPFALVTGGNIRPASGAGRREVAANASVRLNYDPAQGFWSEG
jgi:hypothetical protein